MSAGPTWSLEHRWRASDAQARPECTSSGAQHWSLKHEYVRKVTYVHQGTTSLGLPSIPDTPSRRVEGSYQMHAMCILFRSGLGVCTTTTSD